MTRQLTDTQRFWVELRDAGTKGVHSWDCYGWTRNAPQRAKDCVDKGQQVWKRPERRNGRPGVRFWLDGFQPSDAVRVVPNRGVEGGSGGAAESHPPIGRDRATPAAPLSIKPAPADYVGPTAIVRDFDSDPSGPWRELPWDEKNHRPLSEAA